MGRSRSSLLVGLLTLAASVAALQWLLPKAEGQIVRRPAVAIAAEKEEGEDLGEASFPPPDRSIVQLMNRSREALRLARYGDVVEGLDKILKCTEDFFFQPDPKAPIYRSLKSEARQMIGRMPSEGRQLYELRCGADARAMLAKALANRDLALLAHVSGQYFHTQAGYEATFLLGLSNLDHGSPLAGALMLRRLREAPDAGDRFEPALSLAMAACWLQAGMPDDAQRALAALKERNPKSQLVIGGQEIPWFEKSSEAVAWFARLSGPQRSASQPEADRWAMYRGDPARNAATIGSPPLLNMRWSIPISDDPTMEQLLTRNQQLYRRRGAPMMSSLNPLAVDDVVLMRDAWYLWAVDFNSGKRLWTTRPLDDDPWQSLGGRVNVEAQLRQPQSTWGIVQVAQRVWDDATYGTLSSDGRLVFSIEDLTSDPNMYNASRGIVFGFRRQDNTRGPSNRLVAHNVRTGKIQWELGGEPGQMALPLAETFFLGPPLPLRGQLFVLAEAKEEIRLLVLDPNDKGKLLWSQQLTTVERSVTMAPLRRLAGVSPSYSDGVLICPTGAGAVVAVDLATRSLLWGYRYPMPKDGNNDFVRGQQMMAWQFNGGYYDGMTPVTRWLDSTATVVDGRVLLTPAESDSLHCLRLIDGQPAWDALPRKRNENDYDLYVACVHKGIAVLVGQNGVRGVRLEDGKSAWDGRTVGLPQGAAVSGRGFYSNGHYYLPLSTAEVMTVDLDAGKQTQLAKSRKGNVPGNLVCYKGKVISQGLESVDTFYQIDAAREEIRQRLAAKPEDAEALSLRGEMLMDEGKPVEAVASFRRAYELDSDPRTRELLRDALLDGLNTDFAAHRQFAPEIEKLLDDAPQRSTYLRLMAAGLQRAGEWRAALEQYLKLAELEQAQRPMELVDRSLLVRRDRWVQTRLTALRREAGPQGAAEIDKAVEERLKTALETQGVDALRQFLDYFGNQPAAAAARQELIKRLAVGGRLLEAELLLWPDRYGADRAAAGAAWAELADLFTHGGKPEAAAACYQQLAADYADVVCRDGKTGKQLLAALPQDSAVRRAIPSTPTWPVGKAEATKSSPASRSVYGRFDVAFQGNPGPFFQDTTLRFNQQGRQAILVLDSLGRQKFEAQLTDGVQQLQFSYNPNMTQARIQGHLAVLSMGTKIIAIDPHGVSGNNAKLLWSQDLTDASADLPRGGQIVVQGQVIIRAGGVVRLGGSQEMPSRMNSLGPVTSRYACFMRLRNLVVVDPLTGEPLWIRQDVPVNSEMFGDEQYIFVLPPDQNEATVYRAQDGELLGKRPVQRAKHRQGYSDGMQRSMYSTFNVLGTAMLGRYVLTWDQENNQRVLRLFDPWEQKDLWPPRKFAAGSQADLVQEDAIGVFEPDGHFVLMELPSGRTIADVKLQPEKTLSEIVVTRLGRQYFLLTNDGTNPQRPNQVTLQPLQGTLYQPVRKGRLYALDLQGKTMWPSPVAVQDQYFLLNQPADVPLLAFACMRYEQRGNPRVRTSLACVDRRTGRLIPTPDYPNQHTMCMDIVGDPEHQSVELRLQNNSTVLKFTDKPLPPLPPGGETTYKPGQGRVTDALMQVAERLAGSVETTANAAENISNRVESRLQGEPVPEPPRRRPVPVQPRR